MLIGLCISRIKVLNASPMSVATWTGPPCCWYGIGYVLTQAAARGKIKVEEEKKGRRGTLLYLLDHLSSRGDQPILPKLQKEGDIRFYFNFLKLDGLSSRMVKWIGADNGEIMNYAPHIEQEKRRSLNESVWSIYYSIYFSIISNQICMMYIVHSGQDMFGPGIGLYCEWGQWLSDPRFSINMLKAEPIEK